MLTTGGRLSNLLPIGQFSRICSLTVKALRHYDQIGLLRPARIDQDSGYRYYTLAQIPDAGRIRLLRSLDMPLEDVTEYLTARDADARRAILLRHRQRTEQKLAESRQALSLLDCLINKGETMSLPYQVSEKEVPEQRVASIRLHTSLKQIGADFESAFKEIFPTIGKQRVTCVGAPVAVYHDPEFNQEDIDLEICVPVDRLPEPAGRVQGRVLPPAKVACTLHVGPYAGLQPAYQAVGQWIEENKRECAGPTREVYLVGPGMAPDPSGYRTEVQWPVR